MDGSRVFDDVMWDSYGSPTLGTGSDCQHYDHHGISMIIYGLSGIMDHYDHFWILHVSILMHFNLIPLTLLRHGHATWVPPKSSAKGKMSSAAPSIRDTATCQRLEGKPHGAGEKWGMGNPPTIENEPLSMEITTFRVVKDG